MKCFIIIGIMAIFLFLFFSVESSLSEDWISIDYPVRNISYGIHHFNDIYVTPEWCIAGDKGGFEFERIFKEESYQRSTYFPLSHVTINKEIYSEYINDSINDTVIIISGGKKIKAVISQVDYIVNCYSGLMCLIKPKDVSPAQLPTKFLVLKNELANYEGPNVSYKTYPVSTDSFLISLQDSIKAEMKSSYLSQEDSSLQSYLDKGDMAGYNRYSKWLDEHRKEPGYPFYYITTELYGRESDTLPDTLFMFNTGALIYATEFNWVAHFMLTREDESWEISVIQEISRGGKYEIDCAFDLNGDGEMEYLIRQTGGIGIYRLLNGRFERIVRYDFGIC